MRLLSLVLALLVPAVAAAQPSVGARKAEPRIIAEKAAALPGETVMLGIDFRIAEGWHTYWPGVNDTGLSLDAEIEVSTGAELGELQWPAPHRYSPSEGILDHVFEERVTVLVPVTIDETARLGERVTLSMDLSWLVCEKACIFESAQVSFVIPITEAASRPDRDTVVAFEAARARLPEPIKPDDFVHIAEEDDRVRFTAMGAERLAFYPLEDSRSPRDLLRDGEAASDTLAIAFRESSDPVKGVLEVWETEETSRVFAVHWPPVNDQTD